MPSHHHFVALSVLVFPMLVLPAENLPATPYSLQEDEPSTGSNISPHRVIADAQSKLRGEGELSMVVEVNSPGKATAGPRTASTAQVNAGLRPGELAAPPLPKSCSLPLFSAPEGTTIRATTVAFRYQVDDEGRVSSVESAFPRTTPFAEEVFSAFRRCTLGGHTASKTYVFWMYFPKEAPEPLVRILGVDGACRSRLATIQTSALDWEEEPEFSITPSSDDAVREVTLVRSSGDTSLDRQLIAALERCRVERASTVYGERTDAPGQIHLQLPRRALPYNKRYDELTPSQQRLVKSQYEPMAEGDEPPFPANGLRNIYKVIADALPRLNGEGELSMFVEINSQGKATAVSVLKSPSAEMTQVVANVLMFEPYKPAVCSGAPCAMSFPFRVVLSKK